MGNAGKIVTCLAGAATGLADGAGVEGLLAPGPAAEHASKLRLFGQFVGDWECDVVYFQPDGSRREAKGEWHFGWVLEGRAIQDVWMVPGRAERERTGAPLLGYGTTVRFYDPKIDAWHVAWNGVLSGGVFVFVARQQGDEIVMEARDGAEPSRWIFSEITPDSFRWRSVASPDGGRTWVKDQEMSVRRRAATQP